MSELPRADRAPSPLSVAEQVDKVCDRFEAAWTAGQRPGIEDYLGTTPEPQCAVLLRELVLMDVYYRRLAKETPQVDDYLPRFPMLDRVWLGTAVAEPAAGGTGAVPALADDHRPGAMPARGFVALLVVDGVMTGELFLASVGPCRSRS